MRLRVRAIAVIFALLAGCEDHASGGGREQPPPPQQPSSPPQDIAPQEDPPDSHDNPLPIDAAALRPQDTRPVVTAVLPPPPISGGTLLVSADGRLAVMSDPDRDRISIVDIVARALVANVALEPGDEPGRLAEDASGRVHVVLRRAGMIATVDLERTRLLERRPVCPAPRGLTYDAPHDELLVACAGGELARMPAQGGEARIVARLGTDLRDVALFGDQPVVTRFRSAEVLWVDGESSLASASRPARSRALFGEPSTGALRADTMSPQVAYRLRVDASSALLLSQIERDGEIDLSLASNVPDPREQQPPTQPVISPYGGGGGPATPVGIGTCSGVVQPLLSQLNADGSVAVSRRIPGTLVVDAALSRNGAVLVAQAGALDPERPIAEIGPPADLAANGELLFFASPFAPEPVIPPAIASPPDVIPCAPAMRAIDIAGQVTAVAFMGNDMLAQSREPAFLALIAGGSFVVEQVMLDGSTVADTGHALFHHNAGAGVACASCHAEGGDDGHTWRFSEMGLRRTQSLHVGLAGSAPFHWAGDERNFEALVNDVMIGRMGGAPQTPERVAALEQWIYALQAPAPLRAGDDEAAQRGKLLFEGEAQCSTCHSGARLSSNETKDVGKGEALQVPSLVAIGYRTPLMHDGCAPDLRARFDPACGGGDAHGKTSQLGSAQVDDLIAYLETL